MGEYKTYRSDHRLAERAAPVPGRHADRAILVTGGASGIGHAVAGRLVAEGARVMIADLATDQLDEIAGKLGAAAIACDVSDPDATGPAMAKVAERLGPLDGLVNCAAVVRHCDPLEISRADWEMQYRVNVFGAYDMAVAAAKAMIAAEKPGAIVTLASEAGKKGHLDSLAYSSSKAAVISWTRILAARLAPYDINVNCVCPGGVATPMLRQVAADYGKVTGEDPESVFAQMTMPQLGRHIAPAEVAAVISFLLGDDAILVRGQAINADAGDTPY
ncbi:SDR family oxidoreductase [Palleronia sp. LCG004]|uniref:SDR family NAD(P)-dependent oxidoreductase n=1 Tax=Palleronia sp. LCG004 TaxID=3079304 RepID=UPI002941C4CD|nr:SDR family oxidoreductase [Palleronia sp. LCG004]WOI57782.1 SDR family oxidoreductase [Palleronia sp. LCG004]